MKNNKEKQNIEKEVSGELTSFEQNIENHRQGILAQYKKNKKISNINLIVVVALVISGLVLLAQSMTWAKILGGCLAGACLVYMILHYILTKQKLPNKINEYINFITEQFNENDFPEGDYQDVKWNIDEKIEESDVKADCVYKDFNNFISRNVVHGMYKESSFVVSEVAIYQEPKKGPKTAMFVGKYITFPNKLKFSDRFVINIKGGEICDAFNNKDGIVELSNDGKFIVYGKEGVNFTSLLGSKFISQLKKIDVSGVLLNVNVVIWEGRTSAYLSLDDKVMGLPFENPFNAKAHEDSKQLIKTFIEILSILN